MTKGKAFETLEILRTSALVLGFCLCLPATKTAYADCTLPGTAICNGVSCAGETRPEGHLQYNVEHKLLQYCDGTIWKASPGIGPVCAPGDAVVLTSSGWSCGISSGCTGPVDCANIGDQCTDSTIFAGCHPNTYAHLFIPTTDQEQPGSPGTFTMNWKNATGSDDISTDSDNDGEINHANRGGAIGDFQALQACEDLSFGGHIDWYLPSRVELYYLWSVHGTIEAGGNITNFQNAQYWASTESDTLSAWNQSFTTGTQEHKNKSNAYRVRCVRR